MTRTPEVNSFNKGYQSFIVEPSVADGIGLPNSPSSTWFCIHYSHFKGFKYPSQIAFEYAGLERIMYRTCGNGVWSNWRRLCTTSISDIPSTTVTQFENPQIVSGAVTYEVKNGICYISGHNLRSSIMSRGIILQNLPKTTAIRISPIVNDTNGENVGFAFIDADSTILTAHFFKDGFGYFSISYPVAES